MPIREVLSKHALEESDLYYHLGLSSADAPTFSAVKFVLLCGTGERAEMIANELHGHFKCNVTSVGKTERYHMFLCGTEVLVASHGIGSPSISIVLAELAKLLGRAGADPVFMRLGTCGGLGIPAGTCVVTNQCLNSTLQPDFHLVILGKEHRLSSPVSLKYFAWLALIVRHLSPRWINRSWKVYLLVLLLTMMATLLPVVASRSQQLLVLQWLPRPSMSHRDVWMARCVSINLRISLNSCIARQSSAFVTLRWSRTPCSPLERGTA